MHGPSAGDIFAAGKALVSTLELLRGSEDLWGVAQAQALADSYNEYLHYMEELEHIDGLNFKPKHHQACHLVSSSFEFGAPGTWGCWHDESINKWLKQCAISSHRHVWFYKILSTFRRAHGIGKLSAKRPRLARAND